MSLKQTYRVYEGKHLYTTFPIENVLKQHGISFKINVNLIINVLSRLRLFMFSIGIKEFM